MSQPVQRYQVFHIGMTTGQPLLRAMGDTPVQAYSAAKTLLESGSRGVRIIDSATGKSYDPTAFASEHRLR